MEGSGVGKHLDRILKNRVVELHPVDSGGGRAAPVSMAGFTEVDSGGGGKSVQVFYRGPHGGDVDLFDEVSVLCEDLDPTRLFIWAMARSVGEAEALVTHAKEACAGKRPLAIARPPKGAALKNKGHTGGE